MIGPQASAEGVTITPPPNAGVSHPIVAVEALAVDEAAQASRAPIG